MYLEDIDDLVNIRGVQNNDGAIPSVEKYGNMIQPELIEGEEVEEAIDKYLTAELILDVGTNNERRGRVVKRAKGWDGRPLGTAHSNPLFDTRDYDIEFTDGSTERYRANIIAENMFAQVDDEGK